MHTMTTATIHGKVASVGNSLYVRIPKKNVADFLGLDVHDWVKVQIERIAKPGENKESPGSEDKNALSWIMSRDLADLPMLEG